MFKIAQELMKSIHDAANAISKSAPATPAPPSNFTLMNARNPGTSPGDLGLQNYYKGIAKQESNFNYGAVNKMSGAMGRYQFMPNTLKGLGFNPRGFLQNPEMQEQAMQKFTAQNIEIANKQGFRIDGSDGYDQREVKIMAGMHYGGAGALKKLRSGRGLTNMQAGNHPSFVGYMGSVANHTFGVKS